MKTLIEMPYIFTSNQFNARAIKNGYPSKLLKSKGLAKYLHKYADNGAEFSKTWTKKRMEREKLVEDRRMSDVEVRESENSRIGKYISFLKSKGYKIMKPVNDWIEC